MGGAHVPTKNEGVLCIELRGPLGFRQSVVEVKFWMAFQLRRLGLFSPCYSNLTEREIDYLISITPSPFIVSFMVHEGVEFTGHQEVEGRLLQFVGRTSYEQQQSMSC